MTMPAIALVKLTACTNCPLSSVVDGSDFCAKAGPICYRDETFLCPEDRWKKITVQKQPMRGAGDLVAKIASAVGIKQKPGCGCKERQKWLNEKLPFGNATGAEGQMSEAEGKTLPGGEP